MMMISIGQCRCYFAIQLLFIHLKFVNNQIIQTLMTKYGNAFDFVPANPIEMLANDTDVLSFMSCFDRCHHFLRCRTFVHDLSSPPTCRLYEGSFETGTMLVASTSLQIGSIHHYPSLYKEYQMPCNRDKYNRYMICLNESWTCPMNTFWNGSMCINARYNQNPCLTNAECRQDVGLHCNQSIQVCTCHSPSYWNGTFCYYCQTLNESCILGSNTCCSGTTCTAINHSLSQCLLISTTVEITTYISPTLTSTENDLFTSFSFDNWPNGTIVRSYGCCKPSCAWGGKAKVVAPVKTCAQNGVTIVDKNTQSNCGNNGLGYACLDQQPWNVNNSFSYGYASASIVVSSSLSSECITSTRSTFNSPFLEGQNESFWCCSCYLLVFTTPPITGKQMIVQVIDTNGNSNNHFTLKIPGAGWGSWTKSSCENQFNLTNTWVQQLGVINNRTECEFLPETIRSGCYWRFDWFENTSNASMRFKEVSCPTFLTNRTGCQRI